MTLSRNLSYLMADWQRAVNHGHKTMEVSVADIGELLPVAEAGVAKVMAERPVKHAGWIRPSDLRNLREKGFHSVRIKRRRSARSNMEIFFCDKIFEKEQESLELQRLEAEADVNKAATVDL